MKRKHITSEDSRWNYLNELRRGKQNYELNITTNLQILDDLCTIAVDGVSNNDTRIFGEVVLIKRHIADFSECLLRAICDISCVINRN